MLARDEGNYAIILAIVDLERISLNPCTRQNAHLDINVSGHIISETFKNEYCSYNLQ